MFSSTVLRTMQRVCLLDFAELSFRVCLFIDSKVTSQRASTNTTATTLATDGAAVFLSLNYKFNISSVKWNSYLSTGVPNQSNVTGWISANELQQCGKSDLVLQKWQQMWMNLCDFRGYQSYINYKPSPFVKLRQRTKASSQIWFFWCAY